MDEEINVSDSLCKQEIGCDPNVLGWNLLIKAPDIPEKMGSIYLSHDFRETQERRQNIGRVLKIGSVAFTDRHESRRCEVGDWVHYSILEREPIYPNGHKCFYITDDKVLAILDPSEVVMFLDSKK